MNFRKLISLLLCLILTVSCVFPLVACGDKNKGEDDDKNNTPGGTIIGGEGSTENGETEYTVKVVTVGGMPLEGVMVYIHNGEGYSVCTAPQETDKDGMAKFKLKTSNDYSVQIDGVPKGYNVREGLTKDDRYPLTAPDTVIKVSSAPIKTGGFEDTYELGDVMYDFTLTDIDGKTYKLSEMLEKKDMVMLNFWYVGCSNCALEFPYINRVYADYKDDIEILAINDYPSDTVEDVEGYNEYIHKVYGTLNEDENLEMPLIKLGNENLSISSFESGGWPTTVIIDRYGVVCMIEVGAVLGEGKWKNVFDHFVGEDYKQTLITDNSILNPQIEPTVKWDENSESAIAGAFNSGDIKVSYHPETNEKDAKYAWPFVVDTFNGETVIRPSNQGVDNSFSILYADVELKPGQAIMFDWFASTQNNEMGSDVLYILVDGKDIYSISGISEEGFEICCTYVDPRPLVPGVNDNDVATYEVAFAYYKDTVEAEGDDTVYLKDLRVVSVDEIPVETYIFRYAATDLNETKDGYNTYVNVYLAPDGYYRVGDPSLGNNAPLLLANHLSYTQFDPEKTVSERVYENYELMVNGVNKFQNWVTYGNAASNSQMYYYTPVTEELKEMLVAYCDTHRLKVGKAANENLWLQLCVYYDAYGVDEDGNPTEQLENPIKGLTSFSAFEVEITNPNPTTSGEIVASAEVTYNRVIMPRGYLYRFVPTKSGVYRITSKSEQEVNGWIFTGNNDEWVKNEGDRTILATYEAGERYTPDLLIDPDGDGIYEHDNKNVSLVAFMEAGTEYYIDIAFYDVYATGTFTFDVKWVAENFGYFVQASPGPITYIESADGGMGQLIAGGIDVDFKTVDGVEYAYQVIERDENGNVTKWGEKIYADFYYPTTLFPTQSIETLIKANAFNYHVTELDREALIILDGIRLDGKAALISKWIEEETVADKAAGEAKWTELGLDAIVKDGMDGEFSDTYTAEELELAAFVINEGALALKAEWGETLLNTYVWNQYEMDKVIRGIFSEDSEKAAKQAEYLENVNNNFTITWNYYQMEDVRTGKFHNNDNRTDKDLKAEEYLEYLKENGEDALKAYWDSEFSSILPGEGDNVTDISAWRYEYFWNYYKMDDVMNKIYHGNVNDYTPVMNGYVEKMENDVANNPERQGCVAVTRELAEILDSLIAREIFEDVQNGWLKFCYYYDILGTVTE
ncbi:MAG: TlpA family protein disulfide reductase [Clostridia bacterium]|nr:TlpA family protein disulfide reductase [Clostridia bacterium]